MARKISGNPIVKDCKRSLKYMKEPINPTIPVMNTETNSSITTVVVETAIGIFSSFFSK